MTLFYYLQLYVEDAINERVWVDMEECKGFVDNVATAFNTKHPTKSQLPPDLGLVPPSVAGLSSTCSSPSSAMGDDDGGLEGLKEELGLCITDSKHEFPVMPRYNGSHEVVEQIVTEAIKEQLLRRQAPENTTRNFLRMLSATCGLVEVRLTAAQRLETWLQNPKLTRPAQELLMYICVNCSSHTQRDTEVMINIIKIRLKTKALMNFYLSSIKELVNAHSENLSTLMKHTVYNELSNARNSNNMAVITIMFQISAEQAPVLLAHVLQEILMNREDFHRPLRAFLRELIIRNLRHDLDVNCFCRALMSDAPEHKSAFRDFDFKDRMYVNIVDLVCLSVFLAISPAVKEAASHIAKGDKKDIGVYQVCWIQLMFSGLTVWLNFNQFYIYFLCRTSKIPLQKSSKILCGGIMKLSYACTDLVKPIMSMVSTRYYIIKMKKTYKLDQVKIGYNILTSNLYFRSCSWDKLTPITR